MTEPVLSMRQLSRPLYGMWVCPHYHAQGIEGDGTEPARILAQPDIYVLNTNSETVTVIVNFFEGKGGFLPELSTKLTIPSRQLAGYAPPVIGVNVTGWFTASCTRAIYPSGSIRRSTRLDIRGKLTGEADALLHYSDQTPLQFYPVFVPEVDVEPAWNAD